MYIYCNDDPVNKEDPSGHFWHIIAGALIGGIIGGGVKLISNAIKGEENVWKGVGMAALTGAASGALAATGVGLVGQVVGGAAIAMAGNAAQQVININKKEQETFDVVDMLIDGAIGAVVGLAGGSGASSVKSGAGGGKQMVKLGVNSVKRVINKFAHNGFNASIKEAGKASKYYLKSTIKNTINLIRPTICSFAGAVISNVEIPKQSDAKSEEILSTDDDGSSSSLSDNSRKNSCLMRCFE